MSINKTGLSALAAAGLVVGLAGCGSSSTTPPVAAATSTSSPMSSAAPSPSSSPAPLTSDTAAEPVVITIKDFKFIIPASVAAGAKVTVTNEDSQNHTVTSSTKGAFDVNVAGGASGTFTAPAKAGSYPFVCTFHGNMTGTLVVK